jgi:hypothetical protein
VHGPPGFPSKATGGRAPYVAPFISIGAGHLALERSLEMVTSACVAGTTTPTGASVLQTGGFPSADAPGGTAGRVQAAKAAIEPIYDSLVEAWDAPRCYPVVSVGSAVDRYSSTKGRFSSGASPSRSDSRARDLSVAVVTSYC